MGFTDTRVGAREVSTIDGFEQLLLLLRELPTRQKYCVFVLFGYLHVNCGAEQAGDLLDVHVLDGAVRLPRVEHRANREPQLLKGVFGKDFAVRLVHTLVGHRERLSF